METKQKHTPKFLAMTLAVVAGLFGLLCWID